MEKQRNQSKSEFGRRLLIVFVLLLLDFFPLRKSFVFCGYAQTITNSMLKSLRIEAVENQELSVNTDIKFQVSIPGISPGQIEVYMPEETDDIHFNTLRKVDYNGGTKIEMWFLFSRTGTYTIEPLSFSIDNSRKKISFSPVTIGINPKEQVPLCVIVSDSGKNQNIKIAAGETYRFKVCLQYATQLVQFNWDIPKDSFFAQGKTYEFTEIKQREKVVTNELIPVSDFEWTPLVPGNMTFPQFTIVAIAYNGDKVNVKIPDIKVIVSESKNANVQQSKDYFSSAFEIEKDESSSAVSKIITTQDLIKLVELRSKERHSFFWKNRKQRIEFEKTCGLPYNQNEFQLAWIYIFSVLVLLFAVILFFLIKKQKTGVNILCGAILICFVILLSYSIINSSRKYAIVDNSQIYSIPEDSASVKSDLPAGNRVKIISESGNWYLIHFGETQGWCKKDKIFIIR